MKRNEIRNITSLFTRRVGKLSSHPRILMQEISILLYLTVLSKR
jgi:hypothetical protein